MFSRVILNFGIFSLLPFELFSIAAMSTLSLLILLIPFSLSSCKVEVLSLVSGDFDVV